MKDLLTYSSWAMAVTGLLVLLFTLFKFPAQYGRYANKARYGIEPRNAWLAQSTPSLLIVLYFSWYHTDHKCGLFVNLLICVHIFYRTFYFASRIGGGTVCPLYIVILSTAFHTINGLMQVAWNANYILCEDSDFVNIFGCIVFGFGIMINKQADDTLIDLRIEGETGYKIPKGFLFKYVSCPNYLGEIIEWIGYAIAVGSPPAIAYAFFVACNLGSRAIRHHKWYLDKYPEYPMHRKAIIPRLL